MLRKLRLQLTYANVMSTLAVFFALAGGSAYAINEWTGANIVDESLTGADIKNGTLQGADYGFGSVSGARITDNNITGVDIANNAVFSEDVNDDSLTGVDIREQNLSFQNTLVSSDICDGCLLDQDIAEGTFVHFAANIGTVPVGCSYRDVTGVNAQGDHLLLTPDFNDAHGSLQYAIQYRPDLEQATIQVCNRTNSSINDATTHFNLLVIEA
jgi:uncharacterized protein YjbI with pentapeptide repeats